MRRKQKDTMQTVSLWAYIDVMQRKLETLGLSSHQIDALVVASVRTLFTSRMGLKNGRSRPKYLDVLTAPATIAKA